MSRQPLVLLAVACLLQPLLLPVLPILPGRAADETWLEDGLGRVIAGRSADETPWADRVLWAEDRFLWCAVPVASPSRMELGLAARKAQDKLLSFSDLVIYRHMTGSASASIATEQDAARLRLRRHFDEGAIRQVRWAGGADRGWQAQLAYDLDAGEGALGFRVFSPTPRVPEPTALERAEREDRWWQGFWEGTWIVTTGILLAAAGLLVDAAVTR